MGLINLRRWLIAHRCICTEHGMSHLQRGALYHCGWWRARGFQSHGGMALRTKKLAGNPRLVTIEAQAKPVTGASACRSRVCKLPFSQSKLCPNPPPTPLPFLTLASKSRTSEKRSSYDMMRRVSHNKVCMIDTAPPFASGCLRGPSDAQSPSLPLPFCK